jgi:ribose transport system permease protein
MSTASPQKPFSGRLAELRGVLALVLVFLLGCFFTPRAVDTGLPVFLSARTQLDILYEYCEYGLLAVGMTLVILTGGIDLSVGSVLGFAATLFSLLTIGHGWAPAPAAAAVTVAGLAMGAANGALIARFRMQPFVATLAMMTAARGLAKLVSGGIKVQPAAQPWYRLTGDTPAFFEWMTRFLPGIGVQPSTLLFLASLLLMAGVVRYTAYGRTLYALGGNEEAARLSGIPIRPVKVLTYALCAAFAALAGVVNACRQDLGDPEAGFTFELDAIAAVVIGGTSLMGGEGSLAGTLVGALIMGVLRNGLNLLGVSSFLQQIVIGLVIIVAVLVDATLKNRASAR